MDAKSLFDSVKDCPEVWNGVMYWNEATTPHFYLMDHKDHYLAPHVYELILEALFARATGCGTTRAVGPFDKEGGECPFLQVGGVGECRYRTRIEALVAAYETYVRPYAIKPVGLPPGARP